MKYLLTFVSGKKRVFALCRFFRVDDDDIIVCVGVTTFSGDFPRSASATWRLPGSDPITTPPDPKLEGKFPCSAVPACPDGLAHSIHRVEEPPQQPSRAVFRTRAAGRWLHLPITHLHTGHRKSRVGSGQDGRIYIDTH